MNRAHLWLVPAVLMLATASSAALAQDGWVATPPPPTEPAPIAEPVQVTGTAAVAAPAPVQPPSWSAPRAEPAPAAPDADVALDEPPLRRLLHGFRLGYNYTANVDTCQEPCQSLAERYGLRSPHSFVIGYELAYRMIGNSWLNVLLIANASVAGLEQSLFLPSANLLVGFEFNESFQVGVGMNLAPDEEKVAHMIAAAGWTPRVGNFYTPVHLYVIPDVDGNHRAGATVGVTW
jgi:hypothetical protein